MNEQTSEGWSTNSSAGVRRGFRGKLVFGECILIVVDLGWLLFCFSNRACVVLGIREDCTMEKKPRMLYYSLEPDQIPRLLLGSFYE